MDLTNEAETPPDDWVRNARAAHLLDDDGLTDAELWTNIEAAEESEDGHGVQLTDFHAYMPQHTYIFAPTGEMWPATSVNARIAPITNGRQDAQGRPVQVKANVWLDEHRPVEQMTWVPGQARVIEDRLITDGGFVERPGCATFNLYRPPRVEAGDADKAGPWVAHIERIFAQDEARHIVAWLAHRVQHPGEKVNHALVLGGAQGIGKDTLLEPVKYAIGPWNFSEVSPAHLLGRFNSFVKSVILRVSEARDLGDVDRYAFYEHMKGYTAAPPDVLRCDEKHVREYMVCNVCGVIITTNHKANGIYLPADDRRHYVAWSELKRTNFSAAYWPDIYRWYRQGGLEHVAAYLNEYDLAGFDAKAAPPQTAAFWEIVDASRTPEDDELTDALRKLQFPDAVMLSEIADQAEKSFADWLRDRKNSRQVPHRMESAGYVPVRNPGQKDGRWTIQGKNVVVYARAELTVRQRFEAVTNFVESYR